MFVTEYCNDPNSIVQLIPGNRVFEDSIFEEYKSKLRTIDNIIYLDDTFTITLDSGDNLIGGMPQRTTTFWELNRYLLNYVNSLYCFHEFINSFDTYVRDTTDIFWRRKNGRFWYRFMCEYRDCIVHQSIRIKDYCTSDGDILIGIDPLIEELDSIISDDKQSDYHRNKINAFKKKMVESLDQRVSFSIGEDGRYCSMKEIVRRTNREITDMYTAVLPIIFKQAVLPEIEWLLSLIHYDNGVPKYTFIVNKEAYRSELEPNYSLERYFGYMLHMFGRDHEICKSMAGLLASRGYSHFYDGDCDMAAFIDKWCLLPNDATNQS